MSYAEQYRDPRRQLIGLSAVVVFHVVLGYGLANGLGRKVVEVLKAPLAVKVIEEIKTLPPPPPPLPKPRVVQAPKVAAPPPPAYVPRVEVPVQAPPAPVITATTPEPPPPPAEPAPAPKPVAPPVVDVAVTCPNHMTVRSQVAYPPQAEQLGLSGNVVVDFIVAPDGSIKNIAVVRSSHAVFNSAATGAVAKLRCTGQSQDVRVRVPFSFRLDS